jgi:hypothetical protein
MKGAERLGWRGFVVIEVDIEDSVFSLSSMVGALPAGCGVTLCPSLTDVDDHGAHA